MSICSVRILNKNRDFRQKPNAQFLTWEDATDPTRGYCSPSHQLVLEAEVFADAPHGIQWDSKARIYLVIKFSITLILVEILIHFKRQSCRVKHFLQIDLLSSVRNRYRNRVIWQFSDL